MSFTIIFLLLMTWLGVFVNYLVTNGKALLSKPFISQKKINRWNMFKGSMKSNWENKWLLAIFLIIAILSRVISVMIGSYYLHYFLKLLLAISVYTYVWVKNNKGVINKWLICRAILNKLVRLIAFTLLFTLISKLSFSLLPFLFFFFSEILGEWIFGYNVISRSTPSSPSNGGGGANGMTNGMTNGTSGTNPGGNPGGNQGPNNNSAFGGATVNGHNPEDENERLPEPDYEPFNPNNFAPNNNGPQTNGNPPPPPPPPLGEWTVQDVVTAEDLNRLMHDIDVDNDIIEELSSQLEIARNNGPEHTEAGRIERLVERLDVRHNLRANNQWVLMNVPAELMDALAPDQGSDPDQDPD